MRTGQFLILLAILAVGYLLYKENPGAVELNVNTGRTCHRWFFESELKDDRIYVVPTERLEVPCDLLGLGVNIKRKRR